MLRYTFTMTLCAPMTHQAFGDANIGNAVSFRREPIVSLSGQPRIPVVSGNAVRGKLRRLLMRELLGTAGLTRELVTAERGLGAWDRLYAALANGGTIEKAERTVSPERFRRLRADLPALSLLGSALYTSLLSGVVSVGFCWPVCRETALAGLCPDEIAGRVEDLLPAEDLITEVGTTRHIDREEAHPDLSKVTPMPLQTEALATGTLLCCEIMFQPHATPLEQSALAHGLTLLTSLGGKSSVGMGSVGVRLPAEADPTRYRAWLAERSGGERSGERSSSTLSEGQASLQMSLLNLLTEAEA